MTELDNISNVPIVNKQKLTKKNTTTLNSLKPKNTLSTTTIILADISGSMSGNKMFGLKKALTDIWTVGIQCIGFESNLWEITEQDIGGLKPTGCTNMLDALIEAWARKPGHIVLLTDGQPHQTEDEIIDYVRQNKDIPIDTIGLGDKGSRNYNPDFLREIAELTGGRFFDVGEAIKLSNVMQYLLDYKPGKLASGKSGGVINL